MNEKFIVGHGSTLWVDGKTASYNITEKDCKYIPGYKEIKRSDTVNEKLKKEIGMESMSLRLFLGNALSPYDISNAEADRIVERLDLSEKRILEILSRQSPPPWETPEQYKERTGEEYPDDGPVWLSQMTRGGNAPYILTTCKIAIGEWRKYDGSIVVIANHHEKPKPDWRPE